MTEPTRVEPQYVERDGDLTVRPPYLQSDAFLMGWLVPAQKAALQRVVDKALNDPAGGAVDYRVLFSTVLLSFADIERVSSTDPKDSQKGYTPESDVCIWVVVGAYEDGVLNRVLFFLPYIWVTSPVAVTIGREVFGFPKEFGWAALPEAPTDAGPFWGDTLVLTHYSPTTPITRQRMVEVSRDAAVAPTGHTPLASVAETAELVFRKMIDMESEIDPGLTFNWPLLWNLIKDVVGGHLPCVFLKQFRSASSPNGASYQAIVEANATIQDLKRGGVVLAPWHLRFWQYASHQVIDSLGVAPAQSSPLSVWVDFTFSMDLGRVVWSAP